MFDLDFTRFGFSKNGTKNRGHTVKPNNIIRVHAHWFLRGGRQMTHAMSEHEKTEISKEVLQRRRMAKKYISVCPGMTWLQTRRKRHSSTSFAAGAST